MFSGNQPNSWTGVTALVHGPALLALIALKSIVTCRCQSSLSVFIVIKRFRFFTKQSRLFMVKPRIQEIFPVNIFGLGSVFRCCMITTNISEKGKWSLQPRGPPPTTSFDQHRRVLAVASHHSRLQASSLDLSGLGRQV